MNETLLNASIVRGKDYWKMTHSSRSHTPASFVIEAAEDIYEAGHKEIYINFLYNTAKTGFSILCGGNGGIPVTPTYIRDNVLVDGINSEKEIGLHGGTGIKTAGSSQIYDKEGGKFVFAARSIFTNEHIGFVWDGKTDRVELGGVISLKNTQYDMNYDSYIGVTKSYAKESDINEVEYDLAMRFAKPIIEGKVKIYYNGKLIVPVDILMSKMFNEHPEYSKYLLTTTITVRGAHSKKYTATVSVFTTFPMWKDGVLSQYLHPYFLNENGEPCWDKFGIAVSDKDYVYVFPNRDILSSSTKKLGYDNMDRHILGIITLPTEYFKENAHPDSNKLLGIPDIHKKASLSPVYEWIRDKVSKQLNQSHKDRQFTPLEDGEDVVEIGEITHVRANGVYQNKFGNTATIEYDKDRGMPVVNIPEGILSDNTRNNLKNEELASFAVELTSAGTKVVEDIVMEVANDMAVRGKKRREIMAEFVKKFNMKVQLKYPQKRARSL